SDPSVKPRDVQRVGVIGAGLMGAGIAGAHVRKGVPTLLTDASAAALEKGVAAITKVMTDRVKIGRMAPEDVVAALARLSTVGSLQAFADRDVVVEAVVENEDLKKKLFADLQKLVGPDTIIASNTSTISITRMAQAVTRPEYFAGMHYFNPV